LRTVSETLSREGIDFAVTGLAAAWLYTHFAAFRITTVYLENGLSILPEELNFRDDPRGANLWLVIPNDAGVFQGITEKEGIRCVHPVQVNLDLKGHPERASEAAERLRSDFLTWRKDDRTTQ